MGSCEGVPEAPPGSEGEPAADAKRESEPWSERWWERGSDRELERERERERSPRGVGPGGEAPCVGAIRKPGVRRWDRVGPWGKGGEQWSGVG
jgi:hypothetical protein